MLSGQAGGRATAGKCAPAAPGIALASRESELAARVPARGASGPRAAGRADVSPVHGGTKARENSVARIGVTESRQSSAGFCKRRGLDHEALGLSGDRSG